MDLIKDFSLDYIYVHNTWYKTSLNFKNSTKRKKIPVVIKLHNLHTIVQKRILTKKHT